ncbi:MAG: nitrogen regulation protein NR(I), partial [Burkholderiales bacterium]|nr:nitrogen regulation protein NR(I) [Burkholderiales bacterium]
ADADPGAAAAIAVAAGTPASAAAGAMPGFAAAAMSRAAATAADPAWLDALQREAERLLASHSPDVWEHLTRDFEAALIRTALGLTRGRRIEAAQRLGMGRNTITRKIQELGLDADETRR